MFVNQQELSTAIDKEIRFCGLVPLSSRTKEYCYRDLDVVMRHYNKTEFAIKHIECNGEFKSIIDEVISYMGIEMNHENPDNHISEAERNNRVIKERFRMAYYIFIYKNTPIIMISHLVMNAPQSLNLFPAKGRVSAHYIPHIIL